MRMAHAEICPICHGRGKIKNPASVTAPVEVTCHGCGGRGWVEVGDESAYNIIPYHPYFPPQPYYPRQPHYTYPHYTAVPTWR